MQTRRIPTWLLLILLPVGFVVVAIPTLWVLMSITAKPLHPDAESVPTVIHSTPSPKWVGAAKQGGQIVRASVAEQNLPGVSVAVGIDGDIVWAEGFGFADLKTGEPVTPNHRFRIGTASTVLTSAAAGLLLEQGRLKLDDEIQKYVPEFPRKQWPVTLHQLMGHTSGIASDGGDEGPLFSQHCERPVEALPHFAEYSLRFQPGTQYRSSNYDWILVSTAIESVAKQPFLMFLRDKVFGPMGMRDTVADLGPDPIAVKGEDFPLFNLIRELIYDPEAARATTADRTKTPMRDRVTSYFPRFAADPKHGLHLMRPLDYSCYAGASVFVATSSDLVRFGMAINGGKLLQPATVELLQQPYRLASGRETGYGLGWYLKTITLAGKQTRVIGQNGDSLAGMVASLMILPEHGIVVAVTSNISYADTFSLAARIAETFAEQATIPVHE